MLQTGTTLGGRYTIEGVVGQGGMGAVYRARMEALGGKRVAIKEMTLSVPDQMKDKALEQFRTEATMLANLDHGNLVQVTDFFEESGHHYLVMAFVEGQTLSEMMRANNGPFRVFEVLEWAKQLCSVLDYLHTRKPPIIFRDLKPSNIMVDANNRIRLIDFGIAKNFNPESATCTFLQGMGTAGYAPLEQYGGAGSTDPRSDQYSLGATLYHLLTGQVPTNPIEIVSLGVTLTPPRELNASIPLALDRALMRSLGVRQEERFPTIGDFLKALQKVGNEDHEDTANLGTGPVAAAPVHVPPPAPAAPVRAAAPTATIASAPDASYETSQMPREGGVQPFWVATAIGMLLVAALAVYRLTPDAAMAMGGHQEVKPTPRASAPPPKATPSAKPTKPAHQAARPKPTPTAARPQPRPTPAATRTREPEVVVIESHQNYPRVQRTRKPKEDPEPQPQPSVVFVPAPPPPEVVTEVPPAQPQPQPQSTGVTFPKGWPKDPDGRPFPPGPDGKPVPAMPDGYPIPPPGGHGAPQPGGAPLGY